MPFNYNSITYNHFYVVLSEIFNKQQARMSISDLCFPVNVFLNFKLLFCFLFKTSLHNDFLDFFYNTKSYKDQHSKTYVVWREADPSTANMILTLLLLLSLHANMKANTSRQNNTRTKSNLINTAGNLAKKKNGQVYLQATWEI